MTAPVVERTEPVAQAVAVAPPRLARTRRRLVGLVVPVVLVALWQLAYSTGVINPRLLPSPLETLQALEEFFFGRRTTTFSGVVPFRGAGFEHLAASTRRCGVAWLLAVGVGSAVGLLLGVSRLARELLDPLLSGLRAVPLFAWLPLALIWFGLGEGAARAIIFLGALWPVLIAVAEATSRVPTGYTETARMLGTPRRWLWLRVFLPATLPEVVTGLRLSLTLAWTCVIVGELNGFNIGLGAMMEGARQAGRPEQVVVGIVVFAAVGLLADLVLRGVTRRWVAWAAAA